MLLKLSNLKLFTCCKQRNISTSKKNYNPWQINFIKFYNYFVFKDSFSKFNWEDPLNLRDLLTEDERSIMEMTRKYCQESLMPRITQAYRDESKINFIYKF